MKRGTKILLGTGAGLGALLLGRKVYLDSLSDDDPAADDMQGDSFGTMRVPSITKRIPSRVVPKAYRVASRHVEAPGVLKVRIKEPECQITYDAAHYKGTRLASLYRDGETISANRASKIMEWYLWDGPATKITLSSGHTLGHVHKTGSFYIKRLSADEHTAIHKQLGAHPPLQEQWDWEMRYGTKGGLFSSRRPPKPGAHDILGYAQGKSSGAAQPDAQYYLTSKGYRLVEAPYGKTVHMNLTPGWYQVIAEPVWPTRTQGVSALRGYWQWTKDGPAQKSCKTWLKRLRKHECTDKVTRFKRILESDHWSDISELVEVTSDQTSSVKVTPSIDLVITNRVTKKNAYSRSFKAFCLGAFSELCVQRKSKFDA